MSQPSTTNSAERTSTERRDNGKNPLRWPTLSVFEYAPNPKHVAAALGYDVKEDDHGLRGCKS